MRLKLHNFDSSKSARAGYYKAMGGSGTYVGSASQNNWMISEMKKHGFKQGGTIGKLIRSAGEDGFVLARTGEEILSKEKLIMLRMLYNIFLKTSILPQHHYLSLHKRHLILV